MTITITTGGACAALLFAASTAFAGNPPSTTTTLSLAPSASVNQFSSVSAIIAVTSGGSPVTTGAVKLYQTKTAGVAGSCTNQNGNAEVHPPLEATPDATGHVTFDLGAAGLTANIG